MIKLESYFSYADEINSNEFRIATNLKPEFRKNKKWITSDLAMMNPSTTREVLLSILDKNSREQLVEDGIAVGTLFLRSRLVEYVISQSTSGLIAYFSWSRSGLRIEDFSLPPAVFEILKKVSGMSIITGPRGSGKSSLIKVLAENISESGLRVAIFSDCPEFFNKLGLSYVQVYKSKGLLHHANFISKGYDLIMIDSLDAKIWSQGVSLGGLGSRVMLVLPFSNSEIAVRRLSELISGNESVGRSQVVDVLQLILGVRLVEGVRESHQMAFEVIYMTKELKSLMQNSNWEQVEKFIGSQSEELGMLSLNQSLLNLMLKRKIDLKVGFSESPHPEELDRMFEKIGL